MTNLNLSFSYILLNPHTLKQSTIYSSLSSSSIPEILTLLKEYVVLDDDSKSSNFVLSLGPEFNESDTEESKDGEDSDDVFLSRYPTLIDLFEAYNKFIESDEGQNSSFPSLASVLTILPRLQPRLYSISSSSIASPRQVEITVGVVHATTADGVVIKGVCSNYIASLRPGVDRANISIHQSSFRGPPKLTDPMIMVGAGTGLAPMLGFVQDRAIKLREQKSPDAKLESHLFFGCRSEDEAIYKEKLEGYDASGVLDLHMALSRSKSQPKLYVQGAITQFGEHLAKVLMDDNCHYYVCGDAKMGDHCYEACVEVLRKFNHMSRVQATQHLKRMRVEDRWQYDLWGVSTAMDDSYADAMKNIRKARGDRKVRVSIVLSCACRCSV